MKKAHLAIQIKPEEKKKLLSAIEYFFDSEFDEKAGMIKCGKIADLFIAELAPIIYNRALDDAKQWYTGRLGDIEYEFDALYKNT